MQINDPTCYFMQIKPWSLTESSRIFTVFDLHGKRITTRYVPKMPQEIIEAQYRHVKNQPFFNEMVADHTNNPTILALYIGNEKTFLEQKRLVRESFSSGIEQNASYRKDAFHLSDTLEEFLYDTCLWRKYLTKGQKY